MGPVRSSISRLSAESPPGLIREVHLELLEAFGISIGFGFREQTPLEPPSDDLIIVFGRFDPRAREREFGLQLFTEKLDDGRVGRVAWLIDLYLPERWRGRGAGTALMGGLLELWETTGVGVVQTTATAEGRPAYLSWGFSEVADRGADDGLTEMRLKLPRARGRQRRIASTEW